MSDSVSCHLCDVEIDEADFTATLAAVEISPDPSYRKISPDGSYLIRFCGDDCWYEYGADNHRVGHDTRDDD